MYTYSEMFAFQSIAQQQGSHQQIFLPPRAPQLMQKVEIYERQTSIIHNTFKCSMNKFLTENKTFDVECLG